MNERRRCIKKGGSKMKKAGKVKRQLRTTWVEGKDS